MLFTRVVDVLGMGVEKSPWWGLAWIRHDVREIVLAPIPLNWVYGFARKVYFFLRRGPRQRREEAIASAASARGWWTGRLFGYHEGVTKGRDALLEETQGMIDSHYSDGKPA